MLAPLAGGGVKDLSTRKWRGGKISVQGLLPCQAYFLTSYEKISILWHNILISMPNFLFAYGRQDFLMNISIPNYIIHVY